MAEFEITHPDILSPTNKLDDKLYAKKHNFSGQLPLENLPDGLQSIVDQLGGKTLLGYELVEEKNLPAGTTACVFDGLNGDVDEKYLLEIEIVVAVTGGNSALRIHVNGISGGYDSEVIRWIGTNAEINNFKNSMAITWHGLNGQTLIQKGRVEIFAKTGTERFYLGDIVSKSPTETVRGLCGGSWNETITNINSLNISHAFGSFSGTIRLWKKIQIE